MNDQQNELMRHIQEIDDLKYLETYQRRELPEAEYQELLRRRLEQNAEHRAKIRELLAAGVSLDFVRPSGHGPLMAAVTHNDVALIELLMEYGADIHAVVRYDAPLHRAAEFGADRVVRFLLEQGADPRSQPSGGRTALSAARSSRWGRRAVPVLVEYLRATQSQRPPPPKKLKDLSEADVAAYLAGPAPATATPRAWQALREFMDSAFVEAYSISIDELYESVEASSSMEPELVFACIDLIARVARRAPKPRRVKKLAPQTCVHHGDLEIDGNLRIVSLMVTGSLTVRGTASNVQGCSLFVGGDFTCDALKTQGPVIVGGDLRARLVEAVYNDYALEVRGTLRADRLVIDRHVVRAGAFAVAERVET